MHFVLATDTSENTIELRVVLHIKLEVMRRRSVRLLFEVSEFGNGFANIYHF